MATSHAVDNGNGESPPGTNPPKGEQWRLTPTAEGNSYGTSSAVSNSKPGETIGELAANIANKIMRSAEMGMPSPTLQRRVQRWFEGAMIRAEFEGASNKRERVGSAMGVGARGNSAWHTFRAERRPVGEVIHAGLDRVLGRVCSLLMFCLLLGPFSSFPFICFGVIFLHPSCLSFLIFFLFPLVLFLFVCWSVCLSQSFQYLCRTAAELVDRTSRPKSTASHRAESQPASTTLLLVRSPDPSIGRCLSWFSRDRCYNMILWHYMLA